MAYKGGNAGGYKKTVSKRRAQSQRLHGKSFQENMGSGITTIHGLNALKSSLESRQTQNLSRSINEPEQSSIVGSSIKLKTREDSITMNKSGII